jgi:transglutaminase-like putative cysteine protease
MAILSVKHVTNYAYAASIRLGEHRMMMRPRDSNDQRLLAATLRIDPEPSRLHWIHDVFDNCVAVADFTGQTDRLRVESRITVEHRISSEPEVLLDESARLYPFAYDVEEMPDLARCIERRHADPDGEIERWARRFVNLGGPTETGSMLMTLTYAIRESFAYERRTAKGTQTPLQTLETRRGSCRDFATLMMEAARALGLAARFVTGYLHAPEREGGETHHGGGATHAWCQVYLPGAGWVEFDPTNGIVGSRDLIRVAVARDARQAIPLHGCYYGPADALDAMTVSVEVRELADAAVDAND